MEGFQGKPRSTETSTALSISERELLTAPSCSSHCNLSKELNIIQEGILQGSARRLEQANETPLLTALEISGGFALGASFSWAIRQGGNIAKAAKYGAIGLASVGIADMFNRGKTITDTYSEHSASISNATDDAKRKVIADQIGAIIPDYLLGIASAGLASALVSKHLPVSAHKDIPDYYAKKRQSDHGNNLSFRVDPDYLVYSTLTAPSRKTLDVPFREQVTNFQNRAWQLDKSAFDYLKVNDFHQKILQKIPIEDGSAISKSSALLIQQMKSDPSFRPLLEETEKALANVKKEWLRNYSRSNELMKDNTGISFNRNIDVVITHPAIAQGTSRYRNILFTDQSKHPQSFANQNTVYLWHETLHHYIPPKYAGKSEIDVAHAAIELLTDNELRVRLNGGTYPPFVGHEFLAKGRDLLLPGWRKYLSQDKKDIVSFIEEAARKLAKQ